MKLTEIILLSISLAMDAFSVSVCKGLSMKRLDLRGGAATAVSFGIFQAFMPLAGYFLGSKFASYITSFSHWIAFILLGFIGGKMIWEAFHDDGEQSDNNYKFDLKELMMLSVATSIDALAVGIVFIGVIMGNKFGSKYESKAEIAGGAVLVIIGAKILLEGLNII